MKKFNKKEYDVAYHKLHKKKFAVDLNIKEYEELDCLLKSKNMTKVDFVRNAINDLKKGVSTNE